MSLTTRLTLLTLFLAFMFTFCLPTQPPTFSHNVCDPDEVLFEDYTCGNFSD